MMKTSTTTNRDISWLSFNERILIEAKKETVPLLERIKFLSIYFSNLDEFYRVRMPVLMAFKKIKITKRESDGIQEATVYATVNKIIQEQQKEYQQLILNEFIPSLKQKGIHLLYNENIPDVLLADISGYFFTHIAGFIEIVFLSKKKTYFPENNKLYIATILEQNGIEDVAFISISSEGLPRFYSVQVNGLQYILFIEDIIKKHLHCIFPTWQIIGSFNLKITRDAELELHDEYEGDIAEKIEKQIQKRDFGLATRLLYQPNIPLKCLYLIAASFNLLNANIIEGEPYHKLQDLAALPIIIPGENYSAQTPSQYKIEIQGCSLLDKIQQQDHLIHTPYQSYDFILRFFNEVAIDDTVEEIYLTLYRVAEDSRIITSIVNAAKNGKSITAFVELKARFDEANNIKWAKRMKSAGVKIIYSLPGLKVHSKVALVKRKQNGRTVYSSLFATGNLNECTALFYTDHILFTSNPEMARELELFFIFLSKRRLPQTPIEIPFKYLLVSQFNLLSTFLALIDREIKNAEVGNNAHIIIKLNNLDETVLINKLYEASNAGVKIDVIARSICTLVPGIEQMSENITVRRIVDRYLEHGRIFCFHNSGNEEIFLGSADWMERNIYRRFEICFPLHDETLKKEMQTMLRLQLEDNVAAVSMKESDSNLPVISNGNSIQSQRAIYDLILENSNN